MSKRFQLASGQLAIMESLWKRGEATVAEVRDDLSDDRDLAYTTVATMLAKLERKGHVSHRTERRVNVYRAEIEREQVRRSMVRDLTGRVFQGDVAQVVSHLLEEEAVGPEEIRRLKRLIAAKEREVGDAL